MNAIRQEYLGPGLATFLLVLMCYIAGRVHQFFKQTSEREEAYRDGYNTATRTLFSLATRTTKRPLISAETEVIETAAKKKPAPMRGYASVPAENRRPHPARHRAQGRRKPSPADTKAYADWDLSQAA